MFTLQEIRQMVKNPEERGKLPTAKQLRNGDMIVVRRNLGTDAEILVYQSGYALYRIGKYATVFSIHDCGDYLYPLSGKILCIRESFFKQQEWHVRLVLEGEDRVCRNRESQEYEKNISYSAVSEDWLIMAGLDKSPLEQLMEEETIGELMNLLTERQRQVIAWFFFARKTQREIAKELGLTQPTISQEISKAIQRMRKYQGGNGSGIAARTVQAGKGGNVHAG